MGTRELILCMLLGQFIASESARLFHDVPGFFDIMPFPLERNFDFPPHDPVLSSWQLWSPDFLRLAELPAIPIVPRIEVFCNESDLTLLVGKSSNGLLLTGEEIQLGHGCYSNRELSDKFVFTYRLDECGTAVVVDNGITRFTNSLYLNLKTPSTWWKTPTVVHISCVPKRSFPNYFNPTTFPRNSKTFDLKVMNPSWTSTAESNVYERGQGVNLQVSARTRPELQQQVFIQSCFVSGSPEPQTRPRHAVVMNKGCTAPLGSPHSVVQYVASNRADVVNLVLNTSYLISELYIHCSVLISDQGVTFGSKSCNYNMHQSRWEDLTGNVEVCECCSSKCKGLSAKHITEDTKATVSTGPIVIVDKPISKSPVPSVSERQETASTPATKPMLSDHAASEDTMISGSGPQDVYGKISSESKDILSKFQATGAISNDLPELRPSTMYIEPLLNTLPNDIGVNELGKDVHMWDLNLLTLVDGWAIPPLMEEDFAEESQRKMRFERSEPEAQREAGVLLTVIVPKQNDLTHVVEEQADAAALPQEEANDAPPIIRSRLEFTKSIDGAQMLSYEEEVKEQKGATRKPRHRGMHSIFLDLLRRMDKAE